MSIYQYKRQFQDLLRPVSDGLVKRGFTANQVTLSAVALSAVTAHIIAHKGANKNVFYALPVALFARMALNAIDGMMAKEHGQQSTLGAVLNEAGDIVSDTLLIQAFAPYVDNKKGLALANGLSTLTEIIAIIGQLQGKPRANQGPLGKSDRAFLMGLLGVLIGSGAVKHTPFMYQSQKGLWAVNALLVATCAKRLTFLQSEVVNAHR